MLKSKLVLNFDLFASEMNINKFFFFFPPKSRFGFVFSKTIQVQIVYKIGSFIIRAHI